MATQRFLGLIESVVRSPYLAGALAILALAVGTSGKSDVGVTKVLLFALWLWVTLWAARAMPVRELSLLQWALVTVLVSAFAGLALNLAFVQWLGAPPPLFFKQSAALTSSRRRLIERRVWEFKRFLASIGLDVPDTTPPIEIVSREKHRSTGSATSFEPAPSHYFDVISIEASELDDPSKATGAYCGYVTGRQLFEHMTIEEVRETQYRAQAGFLFCLYLNQSFSGRLDDNWYPWRDWLRAFWQIRERCGREFADRLFGAALRAFVDGPNRDPSQDMETYFIERIKTADALVDSEGANLPKIEDAFREHGLMKPKS